MAPGGVQEGAARLLAHMAFRDDMRDAIREAGAVPALVALLKEGDPEAQVHQTPPPLPPTPFQLWGKDAPSPLPLPPFPSSPLSRLNTIPPGSPSLARITGSGCYGPGGAGAQGGPAQSHCRGRSHPSAGRPA